MGNLSWLDNDSVDFPDTESALSDPNGLLAVGGDLSPRQLIAAYQRGIFPWFDDNQPVLWWTPDPRLVLFPEELHVSKSMRKLMRQESFSVTVDENFEHVVRACAEPREDQDGTWITESIVSAYMRLHQLGLAHSVEVWRDQELVGGLYGVVQGKVFFGESMFSRQSNASKFGFVHFVNILTTAGIALIDCQVHTAHLASLGAREIPRSEFEHQLSQLINQPTYINGKRTVLTPSDAARLLHPSGNSLF